MSRIVSLISVLLLGISGNAFGLDTVRWTEEALLHDGRIVEVAFQASNTIDIRSPWPLILNFEKSSLDKFEVEFRHPDSKQLLVWRGERHFKPVLIDFIEGIPFLVVSGRPTKETAAVYGCPELPFVYLRYDSGRWIPVPVDAAPPQLTQSNISVYQVWTGYEGRKFNQKEVRAMVQSDGQSSSGRLQEKIPRTYDDWGTKYKDSDRNERLFGDCRPPPKLEAGAVLPMPLDVKLELIESKDFPNANEYLKEIQTRQRPMSRENCNRNFKVADPDNRMLGERFVKDTTGNKKLPYVGRPPVPADRMVLFRYIRYCDDRFVWFVALTEEPGKTFITKFTLDGDLVYHARFANPELADNKNYRALVIQTNSVDEGHFSFYWQQSLSQPSDPSTLYLTRIARFRFQEPK